MRFSSGFKVGILTLAALLILVSTVMWVKGRSISAGERITVAFKDINGLRAGSGVQMMGVRIGQVESLTPRISPDNSFVEVKFVITEPNIKIPQASTISIQQTGIIGEQYLEIMPPEERIIYVPLHEESDIVHAGDKVTMLLSKQIHVVGTVKKAELEDTHNLPASISKKITTNFAVKISYIIEMPGLSIPDIITGEVSFRNGNPTLKLSPVKPTDLKLPDTKIPYTIVEPMRVSDFMKLQYRSASALAETNEKLSAILSDDIMADIKKTIKNAEDLTANANVAIDKATALIDASQEEMTTLSAQVNDLTEKLNKIADNIVDITGDKEFTENLNASVKNINRLTQNANKILEDPDTALILSDLKTTVRNVSEISECVNGMTKDPVVKAKINDTLDKLNTALAKLTITLDTVNYVTEDERDNIKESLHEIEDTTKNVKKFSEKLNKRFLLFRLMF
ncbi:MAG: MlaD family protein [Candidatus Gastranaerophilales bacterium]|nr:MlaD family protein [Candidatus Gastranaerophilales bacterium]